MRSARRYLAGLLCAGLTLVSCGRDGAPTAPAAPAAPSADLLAPVVSRIVGTLLKCRRLPAAENAAVIGPAGGTLQVGPHTLTVPAGALGTPVLISGFAPSDDNRTIRFQPQGLRFARSASLTMSYDGCGLVVGLLPRVAYVDDDLSILYYVPSLNDLLSKTVTGRIEHFSGYATAW